MVMPAADFAVASMVSTIPVVVTGGIVMKFSEQMFPKPGRTYRPRRTVRRAGHARRSNLGIVGGNFSNVGY